MPNEDFHSALDFTLAEEGGFVNHPSDPGGATNRGVTQSVYDAYRDSLGVPHRSVAQCTLDEAREIYHSRYWRESGADRCAALGKPLLAQCVFDWAVNGGNARARRYLQCVVGAKVDGIIGEVTEDHIAHAEELDDVATMLQLRAMHYRGRCGDVAAVAQLEALGLLPPRSNPSQKVFLKGWFARLRRLGKECGVADDPLYAKGAEGS